MSDFKINVLVVGSGGREHALAWKLLQSPLIGNLYVAPGNAGTEPHNVPINPLDTESLVKFAKENECFTIVGPEGPLEAGLVDSLEREKLKCFGPTKEKARLETSKSYAKQIMKSTHIPTADFEIFKDYASAFDYCKSKDGNLVIKVDGLAAGKGVFVCSNMKEAESALRSIFVERIFGNSGDLVVIEDRLVGQEVSLMSICDGNDALPFGIAKDHKRLFDGDKGPNTGGMGAFSPVPNFDQDQSEYSMEKIVRPIVKKTEFKGFLYAGLMMTREGPKILEFNSRLGDPETQALIPRLESDILEILVETERSGLKDSSSELQWEDSNSCCLVLCSRGYPTNPELGFPINGLEEVQKQNGILVFHGGTKIDKQSGQLMTSGGRVLSVVAKGSTLQDASNEAYRAAKLISWEGENHRNDIGRAVPS
jgi:phosphoribosylamine--glycine ligase